jgi:myo-inositol 2-dehydrogenase/D-chiro-inositol 1-dehydrogenase
MHAANIAVNPRASLATVYDTQRSAAERVAAAHGASVAVNPAAAIEGADVVLIASSTPTHVDLITAAAEAGKPIFCEKPIDLDIARVNRCREAIERTGVPLQLGFNRRFDPSHRAVHDAVRNGEIGMPELMIITSRDTGLAPIAYLKVSGGLFCDMMIHDFDIARFMLGDDEIVEISAMGSVCVDPMLTELGDVDTAMVIMKSANGALVHINNTRRAVYGHDQRCEVFGAKGMLETQHPRPKPMLRSDVVSAAANSPLPFSFIERFAQAYVDEIDEFIEVASGKKSPSVTFEDGRRALILANAAWASVRTRQPIQVRYD